ncbi:SGNH/GDSL hydrolase family protein [Acidobacteriota bacterium]
MKEYIGFRIKKKTAFKIILVLGSLLITFVVLEIGIRIFSPQEIMRPTFKYDERYINFLFPNSTTVHTIPGKWRFEYTNNEFSYRGKPIPISDNYEKTNVVVLGDSFTYGSGVNDGEEYAAVLANHLAEKFDVINLGVGGWGLTQEIRRFYEFGILYQPRFVILQFCANDISNNLEYPFVRVEDNKFVFTVRSQLALKGLNKYLANSIFQQSHLFRYVTGKLWKLYRRNVNKKLAEDAVSEAQSESKEDSSSSPIGQSSEGTLSTVEENIKPVPGENYYIELLNHFINDLSSRGVHLILISVQHQIEEFLSVINFVEEINSTNPYFHYLRTQDWFEYTKEYRSPEGHWGVKANAVLGLRLGEYIQSLALVH